MHGGTPSSSTGGNRSSRIGIYVSLVITAIYWWWESRAEGNIRVDLLLIYPVMLFVYPISLWSRFRYWSIVLTAVLMAANFTFFVNSYRLFHKNVG